jgi:glyoxylase-like metal-dependent hydrolase (beta-lactamase superfamily II)
LGRPSTLRYPLALEPGIGDGSAVEVAPGVLWLRLPLFAALMWINVWAIKDGDSWIIVDTGLGNEKTKEAWSAAFGSALGSRPPRQVIVTHMHPDHCGLAGWLCQRYAASLSMSRLEYLSCRVLAADTGRPAPEDAIAFVRASGWSEVSVERYRERFGFFGKFISPMPDSFQRLEDGQVLRLGPYSWTVVMGNGHSPEHACLYCAELKLLISGDQVLPRISSNVSVYPTEPHADPLKDWLQSLAKVKRSVPDDVLVLPSHNSPFLGLHERIDELARQHAEGLEKLKAVLKEPKRTVDVFGALFNRPITEELLGMASGEALAHLHYLEYQGQTLRTTDAQGVWWWQAR